MTRTINFDNFRAEQNEEPVDLVIGGETYSLPPSLPASLAVEMMRMQADFDDEDADVPPEAMDNFGAALFGETMWADLLRRHRITVTELSPLMEMVFEVYSDEAPKEEGETVPPTSETPASGSTSLRRGPGSKPTSSVSTAST